MSCSAATMRRLVPFGQRRYRISGYQAWALPGQSPAPLHCNLLYHRFLSTPASTSTASSASTPAASLDSQQHPLPPPPPPPSSTSNSSSQSVGSSLPLGSPSSITSKSSTPPPSPPPSTPPPPSSSTSGLPPPPPPPRSSSGPITWKSVALMLVTAGGLLAYYNYEKERKQTAFQPVVSIGRAALGGPFTLVSHTGETVTSEQLKGRYAMIYFGFTHCPDICPTELAKMEQALTAYHKQHPNHPIQPIFISIDPHRDTPERMQQYKQQYSPSFLFLTGTPQQIKDVARHYRVYYSAPDEVTAGGAEEDYLVDHSIFFYLLDREGEVMDYYGKNLTSEEIATKLCRIIPEDNKQKPAGGALSGSK